MTIYKLKEDWSSFKAGEKFTASSYGNLYQLVNDDDKLVLAKIPTDLLGEVDDGGYWKPKDGDVFCYIDECGDVLHDVFNSTVSEVDKAKLSLGNCFKTAQEANSMCDWLKARQNLINSGARFINTIDVDSSQSYYSVYYAIDRGDLVIGNAYVGENTVGDKRLYFDDRQLADKSIKEHKDDWLVYLGVKEKSGEEE
jgi:hypothetical protein